MVVDSVGREFSDSVVLVGDWKAEGLERKDEVIGEGEISGVGVDASRIEVRDGKDES